MNRAFAISSGARGLELVARRARAQRDWEHTRVQSILSGAQESAAQGKPFDAHRALQQIADVIGLGGPPERRVEPEP